MRFSKRVSRYGICAVLALALFGCGSSDPVKDEFIDYISNQIPKFAKLESDIVDTFDSVTGENYDNDEQVDKVLDETVLPKCRELLNVIVDDISVNTPVMIKLHGLYIEAYDRFFDGYALLRVAIEKGDAEIVSKANEKFSMGRKLQRQWLTGINELKKKYGIAID